MWEMHPWYPDLLYGHWLQAMILIEDPCEWRLEGAAGGGGAGCLRVAGPRGACLRCQAHCLVQPRLTSANSRGAFRGQLQQTRPVVLQSSCRLVAITNQPMSPCCMHCNPGTDCNKPAHVKHGWDSCYHTCNSLLYPAVQTTMSRRMRL